MPLRPTTPLPSATPHSNRAEIARWVATWHRAAEELAALPAAAEPVHEAVRQLLPLFPLARAAEPTTTTSGLVEMQRCFARLRHG